MEILLPILIILYFFSSSKDLTQESELYKEKENIVFFENENLYFLQNKYNLEITKEIKNNNIIKRDFIHNIIIDKNTQYKTSSNNIIIQLIPNNIKEKDFNLLLSINDEKINKKNIDYINDNKIEIENGFLNIRLRKIEASEKYQHIENIKCENSLCEKIKNNTIKIKRER